MKLYLAGNLEKVRARMTLRLGMLRRLYSYRMLADSTQQWGRIFVMVVSSGTPGLDLFLDSGAFSAWSKGVRIDLDAYADFILENRDMLTVAASLDVIPGRPGEPPSAAEVEAAAQQGWENWEALERRLAGSGVQLIHTYHRGEDVRWLRRLMDRSEYLAIGGMAVPGLTSRDRIAFLDGIMTILTDERGRSLRRFHGFGLTSIQLMEMYPWYSVDSTSWLRVGSFGGIYLRLGDRVQVVTFSHGSPKVSEEGAHYLTYSSVEQAAIRAYVEARGYTVKQLAEDYVKRDEMNVLFFLDLERRLEDRPWSRRAAQGTFF